MRGIRSGLLLHVFRGLCVCFFSVEHNCGPYKNGRIDRCIVSYVDTLRSKETRIGWGPDPPGDVALLRVILVIYRIIFRQYRLGDIIASLFDVARGFRHK